MKKHKLLFLCTGNSCRSQMAEGWARALKGDLFEVFSAGIETHGMNPNAIKVMAEAGIDISQHHSKNIRDFQDTVIDYVVTVCGHANETCPVFPAKSKVIHHGFDDPPKMAKEFSDENDKLNCYRKVRDQIKEYVLTLPNSLQE
jgi:arsenate reductase